MENIDPQPTEEQTSPLPVQEQTQDEPIPAETETPAQTGTEVPADGNAPVDAAPVASEPVKAKKVRSKFWSGVFRVGLPVLISSVIIVLFCTLTAVVLILHFNTKLTLVTSAANQRIDVLQNMLENPGINSEHFIVGDLSPAPENALTPAQVYAANVNATVAVKTTSGTGSGFFVRKDGYVVTNYHVVEKGGTITVVTQDGISHEAKIQGYDRMNDVAVLKIAGNDFPCVTFGSSTLTHVGDQVIAVGNPLGELTSTLTVGYISAKDRVVSSDGTAMNLLQTDAAINSGNSGGALFNVYGQVIGITKSKYSGTSSSGASIEGIGFAIPIDDVLGIIEDLYQYGYVTGGYLGVSVRDVEAAVIENYGLHAGAYVVSTVPGVSADRAGIQPKDIIINIGGYDVNSISALTRVLRNFKAGDTTTITVYRHGAEVVLSITMDEKPADLR